MTKMSDAAKEARRAYQRDWRHRNPEKVKAAQERYFEKLAKRNAAASASAEQTADHDHKTDSQEV